MAFSMNRSIFAFVIASHLLLTCRQCLCQKIASLNPPSEDEDASTNYLFDILPDSHTKIHFKVNGLPPKSNLTLGLIPHRKNSSSSSCYHDPMDFIFYAIPKGDIVEANIFLPSDKLQHSLYSICFQSSYSSSKWVLQRNIIKIRVNNNLPTISGIRAEGSSKVYLMGDGTTSVPAYTDITIRLYGQNLGENISIAITTANKVAGSSCHGLPVQAYYLTNVNDSPESTNTATITVRLPLSHGSNEFFYFCIVKPMAKEFIIHQGSVPWLRIHSEGPIMPLWIQIILIVTLLILSGLFSGLNLGLMTLDSTELQVISNCGSTKEKNYAKLIAPLRERGNYLLCSLLLGNVLVNSTLTILLDDLTSGLVAIIGATMSIVIIGEIIPQAICSRHGLAVGAKTSVITRFFMLLTFPLSYPISKILDFVLGEEIGNVYDRERLMEYIRLTRTYNKLENEEVNIITGALGLKTKHVCEVMTHIEDVFMLPIEATLNFEMMTEIVRRGYTRIPIFQNEDRNSIIALLNTKDLAFVDPDDNLPLKVLSSFYNHPVKYVFEDETLDVILNDFKKGRSHLALVHKIENSEGRDPYYEITGVITLEDVIEEILQFEIMDETDVITDNRHKLKRETRTKQDFSDFAKIGGGQKETAVISPQMALATYQFLSTTFKQFQMPFLSETVLRRLMRQNIYFQTKVSQNPDNNFLYQTGKTADYFILLLEGRVNVVIGKENIEYDAGAFSYFGLPAISCQNITVSTDQTGNSTLIMNEPLETSPSKFSFNPDYTVTVLSDLSYLKIYRAVYIAAIRATLLECHQHLDSMTDEVRILWEKELNVANIMRQSPLTQESSPPYPCSSPAETSTSARSTLRKSFLKNRSSCDNSPSEYDSPSKDAPQYRIKKFGDSPSDNVMLQNSNESDPIHMIDTLKNAEITMNSFNLGLQNNLGAGDPAIPSDKQIFSSPIENAKNEELLVNSNNSSIKGKR